MALAPEGEIRHAAEMILTELDQCVLAVVWREGPLTAYGVRTVFRESTTAGWSSSSGSIYPAIRRLIAAGLVDGGTAKDRRGTQALAITAAGRAALKRWLTDLAPELGSATPDPIRTRAQFLTALNSEGRTDFIARSRTVTTQAITELEAHAERIRGDPGQRLDLIGTVGSIGELRARLAWLELALTILGESGCEPRSD